MAFAGSGNDVEITLMAYDNITPVLRGVSAGMGAFVGDADRMVNSFARIGAQAAPILAVGAALYYAGQQASQVQQNVANLNAVLHATSDELAAIRTNGLALSQATQFTDAQILSAQRQLAKGGASAADLAMPGSQGVTGAALDLASATGQRDPTKAATSLTTAMTAFQLNQRDAAGAATILAQAVDTSVGTLDTQATALRQSGVVARAAGLDLRATATDIAALQNAGLQSSAGTSLQTFLARVESPSQAARKAIADLNLEFYNLNGTLKTTPELFDEIRMKTMGMTQEQSQAKLFDIFGQRGIRVAEIAQEQGGGLLVEQAQRMAELGEASDIAARKMDTFQGSASKALSSINVLAVQTGTALVPAMKGAADEVLSLANGLSNLNNIAPIIPQMALAVGGIFGASRIAGGLNDRADTRAKDAADAARKEQDARFAAASQYSNAIAQAEFEADAKILAADQSLAQKQNALNNQVYEQYIASEEKVVAALTAADEKRIASLQAVTEKTLASIHEIEVAYLASAQKQTDMQAIQFGKERAMLQERQQTKVNVGDVKASGLSPADEQQAIFAEEQASLERQQAIRSDALQKELDLNQSIAANKAVAARAQAAESVKAIDSASSMEADAIIAGGRKTEIAIRESAAKNLAAMTESAAEQKAAAESVYLSRVGTSGLGPGVGAGAQAIEGSIMAGMSGANARSIAGNAQLAAGTVAVDEASFAAKSRSAFAAAGSKITAAIGALFLPVTVALLANDFAIRPIEQALIDRAAKNDPQLNEIHTQTKFVVDHPDDNYQTAIAAIDNQTKAIQAELRAKQDELTREQGSWTENVPFLSGLAHKVGGDSGSIAALKQQITSLTGDLADLKKAGDIEAVVPQKALSSANDEMATLIGQFKDGTITQAQMEAQWAAWGSTVDETTNSLLSHDETLRRQGVTAEQIIAVNKRFADSEREVADSIRKAKEDAEATYKDALTQANQAQPLGVDNQTIARAYFGKNLDQSDATKAQQQAALKDIGEYRKAWTDAQQAVNQFDISKGIDSIAGMKQRLDDATAALAKLGLANPALQGLTDIANSFSHIADAERQAESAMNAYNLTLDKTNGYLGQVGKVQKDFDTALLQAQYANAAGAASPAQQELLRNKDTIRNTLAGQQQSLSANMALDVLGEVRNLPDFKALDDYVRDIVDKAPGGKLGLMATVTTNLEDVKRQLDTILADRHLTVMVDPNFSQFDPAIADRAKSWSQYYGNMGGYSPYDEPNRPPGGPPGAPPTTGIYAGLPPGTGVGVASGQANAQSTLAYKPISYQDYVAAIRRANIDSPLQTTTAYNQFVGAAEETNVDPRLMMMRIMMESQYGATASRELQSKNNYAGITNGQGQYQSFGSLQDFFKSLGSNLSTGIYQQPFQQGDLQTILKDYIAGPNAAATSDQQANIQNSIAYYNQLRSRTGYGDGGGVGKGGESGFDSSAGGVASTTQIDQTAMNLRQRIVQTAMSQIDVNKLVDYCEQFVEETVQAATGRRGATGTNEGTASSAFADAQKMGLVTKNPQIGDLVYYPDAAGGSGHVAIYVGTNAQGVPQQISTYDKGPFPGNSGPNHSALSGAANARIHLEAVGPNAQYVDALGQGGYTYGPGDPGNRGNATGGTLLAQNPFYLTNNQRYFPNVNATDPNNPYANPYPERLYPTAALPALSAYGAQQGALDARGQGEMQQFFDRFANVFSTIEADKAGFGPTGASGRLGIKPNQFDQQAIDNASLQDNLTLTTEIGKAIGNINGHLAVTPQMYDAIRSSAGPLGDIVVAQVQATEQLEIHTQRLSDLKATQQQADLAYQQQQQQWQRQNNEDQRAQTRLQWTRQTIDESTQDQRTAQQRLEQDSDTSRQRAKTLQDRDIQDTRQKQQWQWQDEQNAIQDRTRLMQEQQRLQDVADTTHKESIDDAFETQSRAFQDQQRILNFRGGQESIALQDARKQLDEQHRLTVENAQQTGGLFVSLGKGASTEAEATAFAAQGAAIDDARRKADDLYRKQGDANTRAQDALSKQHALQMFNLETEMLQSQRRHEDEVKGIDRAAERRHNAFSVEMFDLDTENTQRQRSHETIQRQQTLQDTARQRSYEDTTFQIEQVRLAEQRRWQDADERTKKDRETADRNYQTNKWQEQDIQQDITNNYNTNKKLNADQQQDEQKSITDIGKQLSGLDLVISKYDTLLKMFGDAANVALNAPSQGGAMPSQPVGGGAIRRLGGNAEGTPFSAAGYSYVNERGGEIRFLSTGETILPAEQTKRLMEAVLGYNTQNAQQAGAPVVHEGNVTINLNDEELRVSPATAAKIRALVRDEMESNAPESVDDSWASRGGVRR